MRSLLRLRRGLLLAFTLALTASAGVAAEKDPARLVDSIYAHGHEDKVWDQWLTPRRDAWFSRDTTALWSRCDALARRLKDPEGPLDADIATNSQLGWESFKGYSVRVLSRDDARSVVTVRLQDGPMTIAPKFDADNVIEYDLIHENGSWKIEDVKSAVDGKPWSLRQMLQSYLKSSASN